MLPAISPRASAPGQLQPPTRGRPLERVDERGSGRTAKFDHEDGSRQLSRSLSNFSGDSLDLCRSGFVHNKRSAAETLGEVQLLLTRPEARIPPPRTAKHFKAALFKKYHRLEDAWDEMDMNGDGALQFNEFVLACRRIQFVGNLKQIFEELTEGSPNLMPEFLDRSLPRALAAKRQRDKAKERKSADGTGVSSGFDHGLQSSASTLGEVQLLLSRPDGKTGVPCTAKEFKNALFKKYHSLEEAWCQFDSNEDGELQFHEFVSVCRHIQFIGNLKKIFKELTNGGDGLKPEQLDPQLPAKLETFRAKIRASAKAEPRDLSPGFQCGKTSAATLGEVLMLTQRTSGRAGSPGSVPADKRMFTNALLKKFGSLLDAWDDMDENKDGSLQYDEFVRVCRRIQFGGNLKRTFLDISAGKEEMAPADLDPSLPAQIRSLKLRRAVSLPFIKADGVQAPAAPTKTFGEMYAMNCRDGRDSSPPPTDARSFRNALLKKYGSFRAAWEEMDVNADGSLQFNEFVRACRMMQFSGNLKKIFEELAAGTEEVSPGALDPNLQKVLTRERWFEEHPRRSPRGLEQNASGGFEHGTRTAAQTLGEVHTLMMRSDARVPPPQDARSFKNALLKKYGTFRAAWEDMDVNGDGSLQFQEFVRACRSMNFSGNLKKIFEELANGKPEISPEDLDPNLPSQLIKLQDKAAQSAGA
eukprot:gnl/TRDRNA2_/TRDRNA2_175022_c3_seq6.p1 gnl/TRDRNA2_/TRDRNA2_175022_c3~~gnl/TRDRNA2_/TRDRNA2_175022_c3_seq6.p1  ORF type:complete len:698 (+),score=152.51 gnl/TRDRNA2_/TRDRNA2_175022_c3_seq6:71-2164(+)